MKRILFPLLLLFAVPVLGQVNLPLGLRAYYPFSGNANDASGNNNNPSFNNATLTSDRLGNPNSAYHFNGVDNYIRIPNSSSLNATGGTFSISVWVRVTGYYQGTCHGNSILIKGNTDTDPGIYVLRFDDNAFTNGQNCANPVVDETHQNFYGLGAAALSPGYTPYIQTNQWHHVVVTNDGVTARLYVDCQLKATRPQSQTVYSNAFDLYLGRMNHPQYPYWLNGDLDELRIYDRALTVDEVNVLGGCAVGPPIIINSYTPVNSFNICENKVTVEDPASFNTGDTVVMMQMKGAVIDVTNTAAFGNITDYRNAGNYEFNYVKSKNGNVLELLNRVTRPFDIPTGKVQLIRVPYFNKAVISSTLTCLPWDGSKGGVLVLNATDSIILNADIDVSGKGFRGGRDPVTSPSSFNCNQANYFYPVNPDLASEKGEGVSDVLLEQSYGRGKAANGGGSGNSHNSGGGGGSNGAAGGFGGYNFGGSPCTNVPFDNRGIGGLQLNYSNASNKIFMGGGGGAGHSNNPEGFQGLGGNGGGIAIIIGDKLKSNGFRIIANGANASPCTNTNQGCHDGMGGGGAAGTVLMKIPNYVDNTIVNINGGQGGNMVATGLGQLGPGGGGSGGAIWISQAALPGNVIVNRNGGANGVCTGYSNNAWGATPGQQGVQLTGLVLPANAPFKPNIDSVRFNYTITGNCMTFNFNGLGYTNTFPIATWQWHFGDGATANTQNVSYTYLVPGAYTVKLVVTDINGCKDSISREVVAELINNLRYPTVNVNANQPIQLQARPLGGSYNWLPPTGLSNALIQNPVFNHSSTQEYLVRITTPPGCVVTDTQLVNINARKGIYVPRAFSPNGDGTNDRLYPILVGIQQLYYFRVYNRWGNLVFETNSGNPASGWDGRFREKLQPVETYTWIAQGIDVDGIVIKASGSTLLIR